jgi:hypothetical protein
MTMEKLFDGNDAHLLPGNAELIARLRYERDDDERYEAANALEAADKRIAEERETHDRMMEEGAEKLFAAESEYKAMANLAAAYLRDKHEAESKLTVAREALSAMLLHYKRLVDSGDAGNWTPEDEPVCKQAIDALAQIGGDDAG